MTNQHHLLLAVVAIFICANPAPATVATEPPPNIILIFTDDQGYNDLGCFGSTTIKTPHLDQLAGEGMRLTNFHVPSSVCSPSRAGLLTGCYPKRVGMHKGVLFPHSKTGLHPDEYTIADHLQANGYATACIGKWHLGHFSETLPRAQGFDSYYGIPYSNDMNHPDNKDKTQVRRDESWVDQDAAVALWKTPLIGNEEIIELPVNQRTITRRYTDKAIAFVTENKDRPFFLYLPHSMPHVPLFVPEDVYDPDPQNAYTCVIEHIDAEIGRLMQSVRDLDLSAKTYVIFTSDNGPWLPFKNHGGSAYPLRDGKGTTFEGGQRVPCIVWAPGRVPAGSTSDGFASTIDLLPTIAALIDAPLPAEPRIDGLDISQVLTSGEPSPRDEFLYYARGGQLEGIRQGDWKLLRIAGGKKNKPKQPAVHLFNLTKDMSETTNLAEDQPDRVEALIARMNELDAEITANSHPVWHAPKNE